MSRVLIGAIAAGFAIYIWGFLFWGVSSWPYGALSHTADDAAAGQMLLQHFPETGTYYVPGPHNAPETLKNLHESGPVAFVFFNREGKSLMSPSVMILGLVHSLVIAFVVGLALHWFANGLPGYGDRVKLIALVGVAVAIWSPLANIIWWFYPPGWQLWIILHDVVAWLLMGLVLAYFIRARSPA